MKIFLSLILSVLACFLLIGRVPFFWVKLVFVYLPFVGIIVGSMMGKILPDKYFSVDEMSGYRKTNSDAPRFVSFFLSDAVDICIGLLIGFSIAYFYLGGWTNELSK